MISRNLKATRFLFARPTRLFSVSDIDPKTDYYRVLGVRQTDDEKTIKREYYKLAQKYHPDKNEGKTSDRFKEISNAYSVLGDKSKRTQYDQMRSFQGQQQPYQSQSRASQQQAYQDFSGF